jgi:hypothetical protein
MKRLLIIKQQEYIDWMYNDTDSLIELGVDVVRCLSTMGKYTLTIKSVFLRTGYLPANLILNKKDFKDLIVDDELDEAALDKCKVEWR